MRGIAWGAILLGGLGLAVHGMYAMFDWAEKRDAAKGRQMNQSPLGDRLEGVAEEQAGIWRKLYRLWLPTIGLGVILLIMEYFTK
jgi:hypothetical protein